MERLIIILFPFLFLSCSPKPEVQYIYKTQVVEVPVYKSPLDNQTILIKPELERFYFSEEGNICLDENNFKILVNDLLLMKNYIDKVDNIFLILKDDN